MTEELYFIMEKLDFIDQAHGFGGTRYDGLDFMTEKSDFIIEKLDLIDVADVFGST
jgi:hypothetical protein